MSLPVHQTNRLSSPTIRGQINRLRKLVEKQLAETIARHSSNAAYTTHDADGATYSEPLTPAHLASELRAVRETLSVLNDIQVLTAYRKEPL